MSFVFPEAASPSDSGAPPAGWNSLALTHDFIARRVRTGDLCIDATAGRGRDTVLLAKLTGPAGRVIALDIQPEAVEATRALVRREGVADRVEVRLLDHREMGELAEQGTVGCVAFNLGWLPGGDHAVHTRAESTIPALEAALELLRPGGVVSLCIYYGKQNGYEERDRVLEWLETLDDRRYSVIRVSFPNRKNDPPIPVFIQKNGS